MQDLSIAVERTIANGIDIEWALANEKNDELCDKVFGNINLSPRDKRRYYKNNADALEAFKLRKQNGLGLSERVWEYTDGYKDELEKGLSLALGKGKNAQQMAKELQGYLRNPDKLFRRVRDKYGILKLSKPASKYHHGRGVYRSSYKNALRLAVTETNMAYRASDHARYQQLDFIVGQEVHISQTNHPVTDICDELKGRYPKDFKFVGWHPFCRCYVTSVLKSESEFLSDLNNNTNTPSRNAVTDVPGAFKKWVENNAGRIEAADAKGTSPYFIRDNKDAVNDILRKKKQEENKSKSPLQIAEERHVARTPEYIASVQQRWNQRLIRNLSNDAIEINAYDDFYSQHISSLRTALHAKDEDAFKTQYQNAARAMKNLRNKIIGAVIPYTPHTAMKAEYKTLEEVRVSLKTIGNEKAWFPAGRMRRLESASINANGSSNRIIGRIRLTSERSNLVLSAMAKIGKGKAWTITQAEADAMATLWHEMNHQMHIGNEIPGSPCCKSRSYMELANEFISRRTLPNFYKSFGCKTTPYPGFIERRDSTGYDVMVCRYQYAINAGKLKLDDVVLSVRNGLLNSPYNKQKTVLIDGLIAGGMNGKRTDIAKLVEMCESEKSEEAILKFMKENGLIQSGSNP